MLPLLLSSVFVFSFFAAKLIEISKQKKIEVLYQKYPKYISKCIRISELKREKKMYSKQYRKTKDINALHHYGIVNARLFNLEKEMKNFPQSIKKYF